MKKVEIHIEDKVLKLTAKEFVELWTCARKMVDWGADGCY